MQTDPTRSRRGALRGLAGLALSAGAAGAARAQGAAPPASGRVVRILVGFPPGQATDQVARMLAERLTGTLGQPVIVDNRPGQGGSLVLAQLARAPADGSVLTLSALAAYSVNPYLYPSVGYDSVRDFDPIGLVADLPLALVVHPSVPATTLKGLVEHAKANPDALSHMSAGSGTLSHLMMEDFKQRAGIRILHVPYKGSPPALVDLIGGTVQVGLDTVVVTQPHVRSGKLRLLAVGTRERLPAFPDAPTIAESGYPGFEAVAWIALAAPKGTPRELRERINADVTAALRDPAFAERMRGIGAQPRGSTVDEFGTFLAAEQQRWKAIVERTGAKAE
jgi:tripartite-type tricarboxylate transporter receptor subunit TctC